MESSILDGWLRSEYTFFHMQHFYKQRQAEIGK